MERIHRLVHEYRRPIAATLTGLAVLAGLTAVRHTPASETILVARHDLRSGQVVAAGDLRTSSVPPSAVPSGMLARAEAVGRRVAGPMRAGEPLTDVRVVVPGSLAGRAEGSVFTTVRIDRDDLLAIRVGDRVDVVAVSPGGDAPARVVVRDVEVVTVPDVEDPESSSLGVATTEDGALALATAALSDRLSVITSAMPGTSVP